MREQRHTFQKTALAVASAAASAARGIGRLEGMSESLWAMPVSEFNLEQLDRSSSARAPELQERRDKLARRLEAAA